MATAIATDKLQSNLAVTHYDFDPDGTDAVDVAWVDMRGFEGILVSFTRTVGTSNLDTFALIANSESDGSGTDVEIKAHAVASEPNAAGDYIFLEASAEEIGAAGTDLRYVSVSAEFATGTDEGVVTYIRKAGRFAHDALTSDNIS